MQGAGFESEEKNHERGKTMFKKKWKKIATTIMAVCMLMGTMTTTAQAAGEVTTLPDSTSERKLTIHKYSPIGENDGEGNGTSTEIGGDKKPLKNVEFEIYKVPTDVTTTDSPTEDDAKAIIEKVGTPTVTVATGEDGTVTHSFGNGTANDGVYLVVEKANPAVATKADSFYVNIPMTNPSGDGWLYDVHVYPKNNLNAAPTVDKDVTSIGKKTDTSDMEKDVTWIIRGNVPSDLYYTLTDGKEVYAAKYEFTDKLDSRLSYVKNSVEVKVYGKNGKENVTLDKDTDYTLTEPTVTSGGTLKVELTDAGKKKVMINLGTPAADATAATPEVRVYFKANINNTAALATPIPNNVTLDYTNSVGNEFDPVDVPEEQRPEVHTGGTSLYKYDAANKTIALSGAKFKVARVVKKGETADATITVGGQSKNIIYMDFFDSATATARVDEVTTGSDGKAVIRGLNYGDYYLIETQAPTLNGKKYNLLSEPKAFTVDENSHKDEKRIEVPNKSGFTLPKTGGIGTVMFTVAGIGILAVALALILGSMKRKKHNA